MKVMTGKTALDIENERIKADKKEKEFYVESKLREDYSLEEELDMLRNAINSIVQYFKMPKEYVPDNFFELQEKITELRIEANERETESQLIDS